MTLQALNRFIVPSNEEVRESMLNRALVPALEDLLAKEIEIFERLETEHKQFGEELKGVESTRLKILFTEVKRWVDSFLDVRVSPPSLRRTAINGFRYDYKTKTILYLEHADIESAACILGHEYVHHVQQEVGLGDFIRNNWAFREGHARGVQMNLAKSFASKYRNAAYTYDVTQLGVVELCNVYVWMAKELGVRVNNSLLKYYGLNSRKMKMLEEISEKSGKPDDHPLGTAFFMLLEAKHGPEIYRRALQPA